MQRRTHECFRRSLRDAPGVRVSSYAPFVPTVSDTSDHDVRDNRDLPDVQDADGRAVWSMRRFTDLLLGEIAPAG